MPLLGKRFTSIVSLEGGFSFLFNNKVSGLSEHPASPDPTQDGMTEETTGVETSNDLVATDTVDTSVSPESIGNTNDAADTVTDTSDVTDSTIESPSEADEADTNPVLPEDEYDSVQQEIQEALSREDAPQWFRQLARKAEKTMKSAYETSKPFQDLKTYLDEQQLQGHVEMIKALNDYQVGANGPEPNINGFVEKLAEYYPEQLQEIVTTIASRPVEGYANLFQAALAQQGIDPSQIEAYKEFVANGGQAVTSQTQYDHLVPSEYKEVFSTLPPEVQEEIAYLTDDAQKNILSRYDAAFKAEKAQNEAIQAEQQREAQAIEAEAAQKFSAAADTALNAFRQTLEKVQFDADSGRNAFIVQQNLNTVLTALNPYAWGHDIAKESLNAIGVQVDTDRINNILTGLEQESKVAAHFAKRGQAAQQKQAEAKAARYTQELIAQGHKIAAQIMKTRSGTATTATPNPNVNTARDVIQGGLPSQGGTDWLKNLPPAGTEERRLAIARMNQ